MGIDLDSCFTFVPSSGLECCLTPLEHIHEQFDVHIFSCMQLWNSWLSSLSVPFCPFFLSLFSFLFVGVCKVVYPLDNSVVHC